MRLLWKPTKPPSTFTFHIRHPHCQYRCDQVPPNRQITIRSFGVLSNGPRSFGAPPKMHPNSASDLPPISRLITPPGNGCGHRDAEERGPHRSPSPRAL
ncbi:unnamed protein product [Phyllotreta striolata]|uniref:Uncharacterized protein n=1 Tax=Phyllotreta striolata TaxID=444603 RepID=A0A9N9XLE9_PHYSR|nr:unnamed protein product [Phyllotreta striolata]